MLTVQVPLQDGFEKDDILVSIENESFGSMYDFYAWLEKNKKSQLEARVLRNGTEVSITLQLEEFFVQKASGKEPYYKFKSTFWGTRMAPPMAVEQYGLLESLSYGVSRVWQTTKLIVEALIGLVLGEVPLKSLGGPVFIAKIAGDSAKSGLMTFLEAMALISVNLGVLNLFPIPILDGGQIILACLQAVRKRPLSEKAIEGFYKLGFVMVFALMILATYNDLSRFWVGFLKEVRGFFG
jgi:regulator of sigma E protease